MPKKYMIVVDGEQSTKYKYNLWEVHEYADNTVSEDRRKVESDSLDDFVNKVSELLREIHEHS